MNAKQLIAAVLAIAAAGSVFAQGAPAGLTREQVSAEFLRARAAGEINYSEADYDRLVLTPAASGVTRAEVVAELVRARAAGEMNDSEVDYPHLPAVASTTTRVQVTAAFLEARKNGQIPQTEADYDVARTQSRVVNHR